MRVSGRKEHDWPETGGEMGALVRDLDWSQTPLGPISSWSPSLRMTVRFLLVNRFPILLWWGQQFCQIYNDAYSPILGAKHPHQALGKPVQECWSEIWHILKPLIETPYSGGPATWMEDITLEINRHGFIEETHFTIAYSPVPDETEPNGIGGVIATVHEISEKVVAERRIVVLRDLGGVDAKTADEACSVLSERLAPHPKDIPFALIYLLDSQKKIANLAGTTGVSSGTRLAPEAIDLRKTSSTWNLLEVLQTESMRVVEDLSSFGGDVPRGPWADSPRSAVIAPIHSNIAHQLSGFFVAGISSRLRLDDTYLSFIELTTSQIALAVSNAKAFEEEKRRAEKLAELDRAKTTFFSNVSHEFRTPLTLMLGPLSDLLSKSEIPGPIREQLETAHRNSLRLQKLVNTLLDFSRIEAGRIQASYRSVDLANFTVDVASAFRSAIESAGLTFEVDCPLLPEPAYVDREMWEKIVLNLISNAFKFTLEGKIYVSLKCVENKAELTIRDTGTGIAAEELPRIFDRFHRVQTSNSRTFEGSGIGLAMVQELVKLHGGDIRVSSEVGSGTSFTVSIPLGAAHLPVDRINTSAQPPSSSVGANEFVEEALRWLPNVSEARKSEDIDFAGLQSAPRDSGMQKKRILLADDNADIRQYMERLLTDRYVVETVADGQAALDASLRNPPDLVISDVMMPRLDGFGLLKALRSDEATATIPIILLSARAGEESYVEGIEAGADDYLIKPFSARELVARVQGVLRLSEVRNEAMRETKESEERFRSVLAIITDILWIAGPDGAFITPQPAWAYYTGQDWQEMQGFGWTNAMHPEDRSKVQTAWRVACRDRSVFESSGRLWHKASKRYRHVLARATPLFHADGSLKEWVGAHTDVQERKAAEELLRQSQRQMQHALAASEKASQLKDEFLATISHELRTPLNTILGWAHMLQSRTVDSNVGNSAISAIYSSAKAQAQIIDDLLDVARIVGGQMNLRPETVLISDVLSSSITTVGHAVRAKKIQLNIQYLNNSENSSIYADGQRLQQVFWNLLTNAIKFSPHAGTIEIILEESESEIRISFRDHGIGIQPAFLPHVFERFRQADSSTSRKFGGLGLGLAIAKNLVEMHGGTLHVESEGEGKGATFSVRLPAVEKQSFVLSSEAASPLQKQENTAYNIHFSGHRILLVDDDSNTLNIFHTAFELCGASVKWTQSAADSMEIAKQWKPDLLISDIGMPDRDGYWLIRELRNEPAFGTIPAIALTAYASPADRAAVLAAGFNMLVVKPVEPAELLSLAKTLLSNPFPASGQPIRKEARSSSLLAGKKVLVVEDDLLSIEVLRLSLENEGVQFRYAARASQALDMVQQWKPDIIISDLGLPGEDGYSLIQKIRALPFEEYSHIPAIALTGYGAEEGQRAIQAGFHMYRRKPVEPSNVISLLNELLAQKL